MTRSHWATWSARETHPTAWPQPIPTAGGRGSRPSPAFWPKSATRGGSWAPAPRAAIPTALVSTPTFPGSGCSTSAVTARAASCYPSTRATRRSPATSQLSSSRRSTRSRRSRATANSPPSTTGPRCSALTTGGTHTLAASCPAAPPTSTRTRTPRGSGTLPPACGSRTSSTWSVRNWASSPATTTPCSPSSPLGRATSLPR